MPGRTGKVTANKKILVRQPSPEIPSPVKPSEPNPVDDDIENQMPIDEIETKPSSLSIDSDEKTPDLNPITILLANGQPLLTNFEEKYLIDLILKSPNQDIETILQEKLHSILQINYGIQSTLFPLNSPWILDFLLKHFQTLITHQHAQELFDKILNKNFDSKNSFKHWQLQTLVHEHTKNFQPSAMTKKRRMTVRHIHLK